MYFLQDVVQQAKPLGYRRYISNQPRTALDLAHSIMTRNDAFWRIPLFEAGGENMDMRRLIGKVERSLQGMIYDLDDMFQNRLQQRFWKQMAHQALLRGMIAAKVHVTSEALAYRDSPLIGEVYDSRLVFPHSDAFGLEHVVIERATSLGAVAIQYPDLYPEADSDPNFDPNRRAFKIEYWSNNRPNRPGITACMVVETPADSNSAIDLYTNLEVSNHPPKWLIPPYHHGYKPHELPVIVVMVNGLNIVSKPQLGDLLNSRLLERAELQGIPNAATWWQGQNAWVSELGRGILSAVEEHVPMYNEMMATILHHFSINTFGQWISTTPDGQFPEFEPGIESRIALTPDEKLERIDVGPVSPDAYRLVALIGEEMQNGTLSSILRAGGANFNSSVLLQQSANAALNVIEPYFDGMESAGSLVGTSILGQLAAAGNAIGKFELYAPGGQRRSKRTSLFVVEFDPTEDLKAFGGRRLRPVPVFKPALPDDLATRIQAARFALDPRRPILSLVTVLEEILQVEDPSDEIDRIWEDLANTDPVIVLEQMAQAMERINETDMAARVRDNAFKAAFIQDLQFRQVTGNIPQGPSRQEAMPPGAGGGEFNAVQGRPTGAPTAGEGAALLGSIGERMSV